MIRRRCTLILASVITYFLLSATALSKVGMSVSAVAPADATQIGNDFRRALSLYRHNMYAQAREIFGRIYDTSGDVRAGGYAVLCSIRLDVDGYDRMMEEYIKRHSYSGLVDEMYYRHALNLFDKEEYAKAAGAFGNIDVNSVDKANRAEYLYKQAYSLFQSGDTEGARRGFLKVVDMPGNYYVHPSYFALGYMDYSERKFSPALVCFEKSAKDPRFRDISNYYIMECRFMNKDYRYVVTNGEEMYGSVPEERKPRLARIISESYLVLGDAKSAMRYYDGTSGEEKKTREDWFYAGSLLYAMQDYQGAIDNYSRMTDRTDSLGQIASYQMAFSYVQVKNKVAAMQAFKEASEVACDETIQEDSFFNYAKLSFDLNSDPAVFEAYMEKYSDKKRGESIYAYQAMAALRNRDYAGAVEAYDRIDELDGDMTLNYMKANYLRANQLVKNSSWRSAVPYLKASAYYSDKNSPINQLSRYWLAESYYRDGQYAEARSIFTELYNNSALDGKEEGSLIPYNIGYCYFMEGSWDDASKWFDRYLSGKGSKTYRRDATLRKADGEFMKADYMAAIGDYRHVINNYSEPLDLYPLYQAGLSYGLSGDNRSKIQALSGVFNADPKARYYPECMYELGRAYFSAGQNDDAAKCFNVLADYRSNSTYVAKALLGLGMVSRNSGDYNTALAHYKKVVAQMPDTEYSEDALMAIASLYQSMQDPEGYIAYLETIGSDAVKSESNKEDLLFNGAEQIYLSGDWSKALSSLLNYETRYPDGTHINEVNFYIAECYVALGSHDKASDYYGKAMISNSAYSEKAAVSYAGLCYSLERYPDAFDAYSTVYKNARLEGNRHIAAVGMMRSAYKAKGLKDAIRYADLVLSDNASTTAEKLDARYIKGKACLASSEREQAMSIFGSIASMTSTPQGAEAAYILIQDSYDRGDFKDTEKRVFDFADSGSTQTYWLARAYIVLGDMYVEEGEFVQARATFESILEGYKSSGDHDDVPDNVRMRLDKLTEMGK